MVRADFLTASVSEPDPRPEVPSLTLGVMKAPSDPRPDPTLAPRDQTASKVKADHRLCRPAKPGRATLCHAPSPFEGGTAYSAILLRMVITAGYREGGTHTPRGRTDRR